MEKLELERALERRKSMKRIWATFFALISLLFGVTASHATLYFPHVDTTNGWQTEICVINPSGTVTVQGNLNSYDDDGNLVATKSLSVGPNTRNQINVGTEWTAASPKGYIVFENTTGWPVGYTKFTMSGGDRVAVPAADSVNSGNIYITHIAWAPWWTGISLVNTTTETKTLTIRFNTGETRTVTLGQMQHKAFLITELFNNLIDTSIESAVIENASGIVGLELFGMVNQLGGVPLISRTATTLFYPHVESAGGWWTGIVVYNPSTTITAQITVNPYNMDGNLLGSLTRSLEPGRKFVGYPADLNLPAATAWFSLQSQIPLVGFELFGTTDNNRLAGYSVVDIEGKVGIFPKIEKNSGWTGIAFVNTENGQATATINACNDTGNVLATGTKTLKAYGKWVGYAEDLFPGFNLNATTYLNFSADRNVAGFQLNNNSPTLNTMLDALPATSPSGPKVITKALDFFKYQSTVTKAMAAVIAIIPQIMSETTGTCPQVTINPPLEGLEDLPPAITITANYGSGCTAAGGSTMSGQVVLAITNLAQTDETSISLDYALTATNLKQDGNLLLNGSVSGNIAVNSGSINASAHFNNFQTVDSSISGDLTITVTNLTSGPITISFNNLMAVGYMVYSGTLNVTSTGGNTTLDADLVTSQGVVDLILTVQSPSDTQIIVNTAQPGTIAGYTVTLTNVTMDTGVCNGYPSSGSATVSQGGSSVTVAFTPTNCPVSQMRKQAMEPKYPTHDLNPWLNISESLYKLLTLEKY
jgi:hypothetical protein